MKPMNLLQIMMKIFIISIIIQVSSSNPLENKEIDYQILKEGISTRFQTDGAIPNFSFQEKDQIKIPLEAEGYQQHMVK